MVEDPTATQGKAIEQASVDPTDYRFPLAVYEPQPVQNAEVSVRFKAITGTVDRAGGLATRLTDADNYYVVRANALEGNVNLYRDQGSPTTDRRSVGQNTLRRMARAGIADGGTAPGRLI